MRLLIILANENKESLCALFFNHAQQLAHELKVDVEISDLYAMGFNPLLEHSEIDLLQKRGEVAEEVRTEQEKISRADKILFIYPVWWWDRPAILKGWFDRVLTSGFAFKMTEKGPTGLLAGKKTAILRTASHDQNYYERTGGEFAISCGIRDGAFRFSGITDCEEKTLFGLHRAGKAQVKYLIDDAEHFLEHFIGKA